MEKEKDKNRYAEEMLFGYLEGTASVEEREWVENWLQEHADHRKQFDEYEVIHHWFRKGNKAGRFNKEKSWNRIRAGYYKQGFLTSVQDKKPRLQRMPVFRLALAAATILAFVAGFYIHYLFNPGGEISQKLAYNEIFVPLGARSHVTLPDGTTVWLNAGSRLKYPVDFAGESREVSMEGEAYFDVAKMKERIFVVKTSDVNVKVYGTQFNIKAYPDENVIQTTLVEGSLSVEPVKNNFRKNTVFLKPNQSVSYYKSADDQKGKEKQPIIAPQENKEKHLVIEPNVNPLPITSWKDDKWIIDGEKLDKLAVKLERRYNVKITFRDESLKNYRFSGTLKEETFEQVLKIVQLSMPVLYHVDENRVTFTEDQTFKLKYDSMINLNNKKTN